MNHLNVRVIPDYLKLSEQYQKDMLQAAHFIRAAVYSIEFNNPEDLELFEYLCEALIALDFPQFVPIDNSVTDLRKEFARLQAEFIDYEKSLSNYLNFGDRKRRALRDQYLDVYEELQRRQGGASC